MPDKLASQSGFKQLRFLQKPVAKIVDEVVVDQTMINGSLEQMVSLKKRQAILNQQELNKDGRFPYRFHGCKASFKYNGKSQRRQEVGHDPPVVISEDMSDATTKSATLTPKVADDMFNYNAELLSEGLLFLSFLDAVSEGDGMSIIRQ